jgi:hypothetical protein
MTKAIPKSSEQEQFLEQIKPVLTVDKENFNLLLIGMKGYGKTSWVRGFLANKSRVIFIDSMQYEYTEEDGVILNTYQEVLSYFIDKKPEEFRLVCRFGRDEAGRAEFISLLGLWAHLEQTTLCVEEIDIYNDEEIELLLEHCDRGRHNENNLIGITRMPTEINPKLRKHMDSIVSLCQNDVNVLRYLREINPEEAKKLPGLKKGEVVVLTGFEYLKRFYERKPKQKEGENEGV